MKKFIVILLTLALIIGVIAQADASVSKERQKKVIQQTFQQTINQYYDEMHRVVKGMAAAQLGPNFWDNDWDSGDLSVCTDEEANYLKTLTGLDNGIWYSIDLTGKVVQTTDFKNYTVKESETTNTSINFEELDPYCTVQTTVMITTVVYKNVVYQVIAEVYDSSPLVLDLNYDNKIDTAKNEWMPHAPKFYPLYAKFFDVTGDGQVEFTEWVAKGQRDGILVKPENGKVENALQWFGTGGGYLDGYEKLSLVCDKDNNGWVEGSELEGLAIWIDENHNALCESNELKPLSDHNIAKISTDHKNYVSKYVTTDGKEHTMWDWWPAVMETRKFKR